MFSPDLQSTLTSELSDIQSQGLFKEERLIQSPQSATISVRGKKVINLCANNYLGLANNPRLLAAAKRGLDNFGFGLASVRFICGTQTIHKELEHKVSQFLGTEDTILYSSCWDANGGIFETILGEQDAVISDALNHASIIDGIRLCKAKRFRYANGDMDELEKHLKEARSGGARRILVVTDGIFSMDGYVAKLQQICTLAEQHEALVMVDDSHATGFFGATGRGSIEECDVMKRVDIVTSTLGKALGGAAGGFVSSKKEIVSLLRQRSRPYLFSNTLSPAIVSATLECLDMLNESDELRSTLKENTSYFRTQIKELGFSIKEGTHPIVPIMLGDAKLAKAMADDLPGRKDCM